MFKASLRVWKFLMDVVGNTPKTSALPTAPHLDIKLFINIYSSFGNPLAVPKTFYGLEHLKVLTAALRYARLTIRRMHSQPHPKLVRYQLRHTSLFL